MDEEQSRAVSPSTERGSAEERMLGADLARETVARRDRAKGSNALLASWAWIARRSSAGSGWVRGSQGKASGVLANSIRSPSS